MIQITDKLKIKMAEVNILEQINKPCSLVPESTVMKMASDLYILSDKDSKQVCGILDSKSFMEAIMDTDVAHIFAYDNKIHYGSSN